MSKLKIAGLSNQDNGVQFYRINQPLRFIAKQKLATIHHMPYFGQHATHLVSREFMEYFSLEGKWADVVFSTAATDRHYLSLLWGMKERYGFKLVIDVDDDILAVSTEPNHPGYAQFTDKDARFAEYYQACLSQADLVVASTDYLAKKVTPINKNVVVVKNTIDPSFFKFNNVPDDVTVGYAASGTHQGDWKMVEPALIKAKELGAKIKLLGPMQPSFVLDHQIKWVDQLKYPEALASMGFSIGIAPLKDTLLARAKSNLRWLEYSANKIPTVASDVVPFREVENIIRVTEPEEWVEALERLVKDEKYRTKLGENAYKEMLEKYDPFYWSKVLYDAINSL